MRLQSSKENAFSGNSSSRSFTLIEIIAALIVLSLIISGSLVIINNCLESAADMKTKMAAFALARENMEKLLGAGSVSEMVDYGDSNEVPGIIWETRIEPFYDPYTVRMWIRAVSSASWYATDGQQKTIEFTQWLTDLTVADISKILKRQQDQQNALDEQSQEAAKELLEKVLDARKNVGTNGYADMIALARELIETYPMAAAADVGRNVLKELPPAQKQEFNIQPHETTPQNPTMEPTKNSSNDTTPTNDTTNDTADNTPTNPEQKVWGDYTQSDLDRLADENPQEYFRIVWEMLKSR
jgi:hypothetical protein